MATQGGAPKKFFFFENALSWSIHSTYQKASLQTVQNPTLGHPTVHVQQKQIPLDDYLREALFVVMMILNIEYNLIFLNVHHELLCHLSPFLFTIYLKTLIKVVPLLQQHQVQLLKQMKVSWKNMFLK